MRAALTRSVCGVALVATAAAPLLPSASAAPPAGYPTAGCVTAGDGRGDAAVLPGRVDRDLDLTGVVLGTTATQVRAFLLVDALSTGPEVGEGHRFSLTFASNGHVVTAAASAFHRAIGPGRDGLALTGQGAKVVQLSVDGRNIASGLAATFDRVHSVVVLDLPQADLERAVGRPLASALNAVSASSAVDGFATSRVVDSVEVGVWATGDRRCFGPPAGLLRHLGASVVQYGDTAVLSTRLSTDTGAPLAGRQVSWSLAGRTVSATTGSDGVARTGLALAALAGSYTLTTSFAGDTAAGPVALGTPFSVVPEAAVLTLSAPSKKKKGDRDVTATLRDDDRHALAGLTVLWTVDGRSAGSAVTGAGGIATLRDVRAGSQVSAQVLAVEGKYTGATASLRL